MTNLTTLPTAYPEGLRAYAGRIIDVDAHEMMPVQVWVKNFGRKAQPMVDYLEEHAEDEGTTTNTLHIPDYPGDVVPIGQDILDIKGARAPSAVSLERRTDVLDVMGIKRQLYYPSGLPLFGAALYKAADNPNFLASFKGDRRETVKEWWDLYNEWLRGMIATSTRIRGAALLFGDSAEELILRVDSHLKAGFRAVYYLPAAVAPGSRSPAHPDLDPLWSRLAEANCAFTLHIEAAAAMDTIWQQAPAFEGFRSAGEFNRNPAFLASVHLPFENFLSIMILGGVFDRHPNLRVGVIEMGSHWVGPMIRRLDMWYGLDNKFARLEKDGGQRQTYRLPHPPSFYLKRNVRVTPYAFENAARDIEQFDLGKVLCFSTDFPHAEGGRNAFATFYNNLKARGETAVEDFFVNNGAWLLPD